MVILLLLLRLSHVTGNIYCVGSSCLTCTSGLNFLSLSCLNFCPSGYYLNQSKCLANETQDVFVSDFFSFRVFNSNTISTFSHPLKYNFNNESKVTPIVTIDRGFYFFSNSFLISNTSWVMSPRFCVSIHFRAFSPGVIFQVVQGTKTFFSITYNETIQFQYLSTDGTQEFKHVHNASYSKAWSMTIFTFIQYQGYYYVTFPGFSMTNYLKEFRMDTNQASFIIGSPNNSSFQGFLSYLCLKNAGSCMYKSAPVTNCLFGEFTSGLTCQNCSVTCSKFPFCIRNSCNICHSTQCSKCNSYLFDGCEYCDDNTLETCNPGKNCLVGSGFNCSECSQGFDLVNGLCLLPVSNFSFIVLRLDYFLEFQGGYFQSGANSSTYSPFNNPETDDPIALKNRGYCFNYTQFMKANNITLNYTFTIAMWAFTGSTNVIICNKLNFKYDSSLLFTLSNGEKTLKEFANGECYSTTWKFIGVIIDFYNNSTHISFICGPSPWKTHSISGYAFYDTPGELKLSTGNSSANYIYRAAFFQTAQYDLSSLLTICSSPGSVTCLGYPNFNYYTNSLTNRNLLCHPSCTFGCSTWGSCNKCLNVRCPVCDNFNNSCVVDLEANPCVPGFHLSENNSSCCDERCLACHGNTSYLCTKCSAGYVLVGSLCTFHCPSGFTLNQKTCIAGSNKVRLNVTFSKIADKFNDSFNNQFSTGLDERFFPVSGENDPIPASSRGFYFNGSSFVDTSNIALSNNFSISLWIRQDEVGLLISKDSLSISSNVTFIYKQITLYFNRVKSETWIQLMVAGYVNVEFYVIKVSDTAGSSVAVNQYFVFDDYFTPIRIGSANGGFKGFIWRVVVTSDGGSTFAPVVCFNSSMINCLWNCSINSFYSNSSCEPCLTSCSQGCVRKSDCNLCLDPICSNCSFFNTSCNQCQENSTKKAICECNSGLYWNSSEAKCKECMKNCAECQSIQNCSLCKSNSSFNGTFCECLAGYYLGNEVCEACDAACKTCYGPLFDNCESCYGSKVLEGRKCVCPEMFFELGPSCWPCSSQCLECSNSFTCLRCFDGFSLVEFSCVCPEGTFLSGNKCENCSVLCSRCFGGLYNQCYSCKDNLVLSMNQSCVCPERSYLLNNYCEDCYSLCGNCSGGLETDCLSCKESFIMSANHSCICPERTFLLNQNCEPCGKNCQLCSGPSDNECLSCIANLFLTENNSCICSSGTFLLNNSCEACASLCKSCSGRLETECLSCKANLILTENNLCKCPENTFLSGNYCEPCYSLCNNCSGSLETQCLSCKKNLILSDNHSCLCPEDTFFSIDHCEACGIKCMSCSGPNDNECLSCKSNLVLSVNNSCLCPERFFLSNGSCELCHSSCESCSGPLETDCISCKSNQIKSTKNSCICPNETFLSNERCESCHNLCTSCFGPSESECLSCKSSLVLSKTSCICPSKTYLSGHLCQPCHNLCMSCFGQSENECLSCTSNLILSSNNSCHCEFNFSLKNGTCVYCDPSLYLEMVENDCVCKVSYYWNKSHCSKCHESCLSCKGSSSEECIKCKSGLIRNSDGLCVCSSLYYWNGTECLYCDPQSHLLAGKNECYCQEGFFYSSGKCHQCSNLCISCLNDSSCLICQENSYLSINQSCKCVFGYKEKNEKCLKLYFSVELKISESNLITIFFQENLLIPLKTDYIKASINSFNVPLQVTMQNLKVYNAEVSIPEFLKNEKNRKLKIDFNKNLTSDQGASLNKSDFQVTLFDQVNQETLENIESLQNTGKTLTTAAATSALCSGAILMNPTMIFNLLNLVEMFSYALLFDVKFHQKFVEFVVSLKTSSKIPTVRLPIKTNEHRLPEKFVLYGIDSSFFIVNGGIVDVGSENIALLAIKVIIINLAVNIFSNIVKSTIQIVSFFRSKLCKKNEKVTPASDTTFTFELNKNTLS